jgi:hypothetical protein
MGVLRFRRSGFLDGLSTWQTPRKISYHNRFGIGVHRSMDGPKPSGEDLWPGELGWSAICSPRRFHRFKGLPDGRRYGLEPEILCFRYAVAPACDCVRFGESECAFCLPLIRRTSLHWFSASDSYPGIGPTQVSHAFRWMTCMRFSIRLFPPFSSTIYS